MLKKFLSLNRKSQISIVVWGIHFVFISCLVLHHATLNYFKKPQKMTVRTIVATPTVPMKNTPVATSTKPPASQSKKSAPPVPPKKPSSHPLPPSKKSDHKESLQQLAAALETLNKVEKKSEELSLPTPLVLHHEKQQSIRPSYEEILIQYLQQELELPEYGEVKLKLTLDREGNLLDHQVISSKSAKNTEFLKNRLPDLSFPCFNESGNKEKKITFTIRFQNAEKMF